MPATIERTVLPPADASLEHLAELLEHLGPAPTLSGPDGERLALPAEVFDVLLGVVRAMSRGQAVTFSPVHRRLTTQEAADILGVSRPTLVKLLEAKEIPYEQPGRHRRLLLSDVLEYRERRSSERRTALDQMVEIAEEAGMYEATAAPLQRKR